MGIPFALLAALLVPIYIKHRVHSQVARVHTFSDIVIVGRSYVEGAESEDSSAADGGGDAAEDIVCTVGLQVLLGGADEERALQESAEIIGNVSSCSCVNSSRRSQGIRQCDIKRHAAPSPVKPAGLIGGTAKGCEGDTFDGHSADESPLQLEQTPCNVGEAVLDKLYFSDNWDTELNAICTN